MNSILIAVFVTLCAQVSLAAIEKADYEKIVKAVNAERSKVNPTAVAMMYTMWDTDLAKAMQTAIDACPSAAITQTGAFVVKQEGSGSETSETVANAMIAAKTGYDAATQKCSSGTGCKNYMQIIHDKSKMIGCGFKTCNSKPTLVCAFKEEVDAAQAAYVKGDSCSKCGEGYECVEKLCKKKAEETKTTEKSSSSRVEVASILVGLSLFNFLM